MAELVANCPRCEAQSITFDVKAFNFLEKDEYSGEHYEVFGICRRCSQGTIFVVSGVLDQTMKGQALNQYVGPGLHQPQGPSDVRATRTRAAQHRESLPRSRNLLERGMLERGWHHVPTVR